MLQVSDAAATPAADQWRERQAGRLLPGEGVVDLVDILTMVRDAEVSGPIGLEVNNAELHRLPPRVAAQRAADAMRSVLSQLR
jgi:sugar phosphate isomerase/epimerase